MWESFSIEVSFTNSYVQVTYPQSKLHSLLNTCHLSLMRVSLTVNCTSLNIKVNLTHCQVRVIYPWCEFHSLSSTSYLVLKWISFTVMMMSFILKVKSNHYQNGACKACCKVTSLPKASIFRKEQICKTTFQLRNLTFTPHPTSIPLSGWSLIELLISISTLLLS